MIAVSDYEMEIIQNIIKKHATDCTVLAFGSRYKWTNKDYSDLDLAFVKPDGEKVGHSRIFDIKEEFEESDLPFKVDVLDYHAVSPEFQAIIDAGNTVIYETPQANLNWKVVRAEEVIDFNPRETIKKRSISKKIAMEQLQPFTRDILSYESAEFKNGTKFQNGDTLMARITPCLENGKTAKVNLLDKDEIAFGSTEYIVMRAKKGITDEDYIYYLSISSFWREIAIKSMVGSSGRQRVQLDVLKSTEIILPPLEVQRKIAKTLKALDDKIENNKKINQNLEEMAQAIWQKNLGNNEPNGILGDVASVASGKRPPIKEAEPCGEVNTPILGASSIMGYTNSVLYDEKILVTGRVGTHGVIQRYNRSCWPSDNAFVLKSNSYEFVYQILKNIDFTSMNRGSTQPLITQTDLKKVPIYIPSKNELSEFEDRVGIFMNQYESNIIENEKFSNLRDTLLPKLMSGEIKV